jgi:hypothetical protein
MKIDLPADLVTEMKAFRVKQKDPRALAVLIEDAVTVYMSNFPWDSSDICVHSDLCMHRKDVEEWRNEHENHTV